MIANNRKSTIIKKPDHEEVLQNNNNDDNAFKSATNSQNSLNQPVIIGNSRKENRVNERFHELFPQIPLYELVLHSYSCANIKSINLYQGIMFLTSNYICFYSKIFSHETILVLKWKDVTSISKINYALIFPTAIRISTMQSQYNFTTFRSRTQTYEVLQKIWTCSIQKQIEISKTKPNDVIDYKAKLENEKTKIITDQQEMANNTQNQNELSSTDSGGSSSSSCSKTSTNNYYCRQTFDNNKNYFFYDLNFSQISNNQTVIVSRYQKKSIIQKAKILLMALIPGFFNISRIDSLLPICFLMCILLLLNAFVLLHKVNQVDEIFAKLLKPL